MGNAQSGAGSQQCEDPKAGVLSVTGMASVTETPDTAKVYLSISVTKPTAADARETAAATANAVVNAVGGVQGINSAGDISTADISLQPNYVWQQDQGTNRINGYTFTQTIVVKIANLTSDTLGAVVDTAVRAGGNDLQVSQIQIDLSPELRRRAMDQARSLAVQDADNTATILAEAANLTLGAVKKLTDQNMAPPTPIPLAGGADMAVAAAAKETATPVQIGTADVTATVAIDYAVLNK